MLEKNFPELETERLVLRRMTISDKLDIFAMQSDPKMSEHSDSQPALDISETIAYIEKMEAGVDDGKWLIWAMEDKLTKKVIGTVCIWDFSNDQKTAELGYGIIPEARGKGLMQEALTAAVTYGFSTLKMDFLDAYTEENNQPSIRLLQRCGFEEVDRVTDEGFYTDRDFVMVVFRLENHNNQNQN